MNRFYARQMIIFLFLLAIMPACLGSEDAPIQRPDEKECCEMSMFESMSSADMESPSRDADMAQEWDKFRLSPQPAWELEVGQRRQLEPAARRAGMDIWEHVELESLQWTSSALEPVARREGGEIISLESGERQLEARWRGMSASLELRVLEPVRKVARLQWSPQQLRMAPSARAEVQLQALDEEGTPVPLEAPQWISSHPSVARWDSQTQEIYALAEGSATFTADIEELQATIEVQVVQPTQMLMEPDSGVLIQGKAQVLRTLFLDAQGEELLPPLEGIQWSRISQLPAELSQRAQPHEAQLLPKDPGELVIEASWGPRKAQGEFSVELRFESLNCKHASCCGLTKPGGEAFCWGDNLLGNVGDGTRESRDIPTRVQTSVSFEKLTTSPAVSCGLTATGEAYCWGGNHRGQLGLGHTQPQRTPARVMTSVRFDMIVPGHDTTCGLNLQGELYCWGDELPGNAALWLSPQTPTNTYLTPRLLDVGPFDQLVSEIQHICAHKTGGKWYCFGQGDSGQLGDGQRLDSKTLVEVIDSQNFHSLAPSLRATCALDQQGQVWCWGNNSEGILGKPWTQNDSTTITQPVPTRADFTDTFLSLQNGVRSHCGIAPTQEGPEVRCWGFNMGCDLGRPPLSMFHSESPLKIHGLPADWTQLEKGGEFGCVLDSEGQVWCWGLQSNDNARVDPPFYADFGARAPVGICNTQVEKLRSYP